MAFSEEWKPTFSISDVYSPPLLLHGSSSQALGPLFFVPSPQTRTNLLSSLSLFSQPNQTNSLQSLNLPNNTGVLLFFPTGALSDSIGYLQLSIQGCKLDTQLDSGGNIYTTEQEFKHRIHGICVSSSVNFCGDLVEIGFLSASTMSAVHWYKVESRGYGSDTEKPVLNYLGGKQFNHIVRHVCWNPHFPNESLVMLENGDLYLFQLEDCLKVDDMFPFKLRDFDLGSEKIRWVSCEFSWHPQIVLVSSSLAVFLVDWRSAEVNFSIVAKLDMFHLNHSAEEDRIIAFCMAGSDGYCYTVATQMQLFLLDIRKLHTPLLQWTHGLDKPCYISMFKLSDLRSKPPEDDIDSYGWATSFGSVILLGSFLSGEFNIFCYGPHPPKPFSRSVTTKVLDFIDTIYAWELPSNLPVLGTNFVCGDCVLREEFSNTRTPRALGFCILREDLFPPSSETNGFGGFTLIRLISSGTLESQKYLASQDLLKQGCVSSESEDSLSCLLGIKEYKFPRRFNYFSFDYLLGYINGDLPKVVRSKMQNLHLDPRKTMSFGECKLVYDMLKAYGVDQIGSPPEIVNVFKDIGWPTSIHELASNRTWAGLSADLLKMAFTSKSNVLDILGDQNKIETLHVPQSPSFLHKNALQQQDEVVGPLLPLPLLLTLGKIDSENLSAAKDDKSKFSAETELIRQCEIVSTAAKDMASSESFPGLDVSSTPSLASDEKGKGVCSEEPISILFHKPSAASGEQSPNMGIPPENATYEDENHDTLISRRQKAFSFNPKRESVGMEAFDQLCPIQLNFNCPSMEFKSKELKGYAALFDQFSQWQQGFKPYQDFLQASNLQESKKKPSSATKHASEGAESCKKNI